MVDGGNRRTMHCPRGTSGTGGARPSVPPRSCQKNAQNSLIKSFLVGTKNGYGESNPALLFLSLHVHRGVVERAAHRGFMMPAIYPDRLTTRAVPQPRAGVRRSSDQIRSINTENAIPANKTRRQPLIAHTVTIIKLNLPHPPLVPLERPLQLEPVKIPQLHRLIGTRRGQQSAVGR